MQQAENSSARRFNGPYGKKQVKIAIPPHSKFEKKTWQESKFNSKFSNNYRYNDWNFRNAPSKNKQIDSKCNPSFWGFKRTFGESAPAFFNDIRKKVKFETQTKIVSTF